MTASGSTGVQAGPPAGMPATDGRRRVVLLIEDDAADADLAREALADSPRIATLHVVADGAQALAFLRRLPPHTQAPMPDLVLLDLNMPGMDGRTVLAELKRDPTLRSIPVVILSSSAAPGDVAAAYGLSANSYVTKPVGLESYLSAMRAIEQFWLGVSTPPPRVP